MRKGKYRTQPFEQALQEEFGKDTILFGGQDRRDQIKIKVAITSTTNVESEPLVLTNYNRPEPNKRKLLHSNRYNSSKLDSKPSTISI